MHINFNKSYTLDVLLYIGCMLSAHSDIKYEQEIAEFMPMLGTVSDQYVEKLTKYYLKKPDVMNYIVSILLPHDHLLDWKTTDLLERHRHLTQVFKASPNAKNASKELKNFLNQDYSKIMPLIKTLVMDLERLGFKKYWFEEKLPLLKKQIKNYTTALNDNNPLEILNSWSINFKFPETGEWTIVSYKNKSYDLIMDHYHLVEKNLDKEDFLASIVDYFLKQTHFKKIIKQLKPTESLKQEFKNYVQHKQIKNMTNYIEKSLHLALKKHLNKRISTKNIEISDDFLFARIIYEYLSTNELGSEKVEIYLSNMMSELGKKRSK